ncbi:hypothetical protein BDR05DRAFT_559143 [Suillus weaverae]|nr:hypothetical protein BDR05DRAFT_559143 [Suillus weaverae]
MRLVIRNEAWALQLHRICVTVSLTILRNALTVSLTPVQLLLNSFVTIALTTIQRLSADMYATRLYPLARAPRYSPTVIV